MCCQSLYACQLGCPHGSDFVAHRLVRALEVRAHLPEGIRDLLCLALPGTENVLHVLATVLSSSSRRQSATPTMRTGRW